MKSTILILMMAFITANSFSQTMSIYLKNGKKVDYLIKDIDKITYSSEMTTFIDNRDGQEYKTIKIGDQIWLAQNLNFYNSGNSKCYNGSSENCQKYGRLYDWESAKNAVPSGWHLPSKAECEQLISYLKLQGTDAYGILNKLGFNIQLAGAWSQTNGFSDMSRLLHIWCSTEGGSGRAWKMQIDAIQNKVFLYNDLNHFGFSVRCIKNN